MTTRPASPPPVARWPFIASWIVLIATAAVVIFRSDGPPGTGAVIVALICALGGIALLLLPFLLDQESRLRVAEAAAHESLDLQMRRLAQMAEHLGNAVSRSQSTEEQAGQALGTIEELAEKLATQSEELTQVLSRVSEREAASLRTEIEGLARERDTALADLATRAGALAAAVAELQASLKKNGIASARYLADLTDRIETLTGRVDELSSTVDRSASRAVASPAGGNGGSSSAPEVEPAPVEPAVVRAAAADVPVETSSDDSGPQPAPTPTESVEPASDLPATSDAPAVVEPVAEERSTSADEPVDTPASDEPAPAARADAPQPAKAAPKTRARSTEAKPGPQPLELGFEGLPEQRPAARHSRRDLANATSLVATAYIGIGNKLFLRGEGPGLSWERGVPMQFLAIGKWGWTTTDAAGPVSCRIYRNDEAPMLDADILIQPGAKLEVTPRF